MSNQRLDRVRELLKREIGEIVRRLLPVDEVGVISVNLVKVTSDLRSAVVFVSVMGSPSQTEAAIAALKRNSKRIQSELAGAVALRYTPKLKFLYDDSTQRGDQVLQILDEIESELDQSGDPFDESESSNEFD